MTRTQPSSSLSCRNTASIKEDLQSGETACSASTNASTRTGTSGGSIATSPAAFRTKGDSLLQRSSTAFRRRDTNTNTSSGRVKEVKDESRNKSKSLLTSSSTSSTSSKIESYPEWHNGVAGAAAGFGARLLTAPLDLVKIRRQLILVPGIGTSSTSLMSSSGKSTAKTQGMLETMKDIVKNEGGIRGLFRGNLAATYLWVGYAVVQFGLYGRVTRYLSSVPQYTPLHLAGSQVSFQEIPRKRWHQARTAIAQSPTSVAFASGAVAGLTATFATYPFDLCRTALASRGALLLRTPGATSQAALPQTGTLLQFLKDTARSPTGLRGLFAGASPALVQVVPYMGMNFALYEVFRREFLALEEKQKQALLTGNKKNKSALQARQDKHRWLRVLGSAGAAGLIAGGTSKFAVYPLDTVKKRMQAQTFVHLFETSTTTAAAQAAPMQQYASMIECVRHIAATEGIHGFYRGLVPNTLKTMMATSFTFMFFSGTKNALESMHDAREDRRLSNREEIIYR